MNMKEVQLLGILAVIAGGIIVLSLWGSQPNTEPSEEGGSEDPASNTVATTSGSSDATMEDWEWLAEEGSLESESGSESTSAAQSDDDEEAESSSSQKSANDTTNQTAQVDNVAAEIEETAAEDIGLQTSNEDEESEESEEPEPRVHTVEKGETLGRISEKYYDTQGKWKKILKANEDVISGPNALQPGMELVIPASSDTQSVAGGDEEEKPLLSAEDEAEEGDRKYTVKKGDTLWSLSKKFYDSGQKHKKILEANEKVDDASDINPGMELIIPE